MLMPPPINGVTEDKLTAVTPGKRSAVASTFLIECPQTRAFQTRSRGVDIDEQYTLVPKPAVQRPKIPERVDKQPGTDQQHKGWRPGR